MDNACHAQLLAEAAGSPLPLDADVAALTAEQMGQHRSAHFAFQALWEGLAEGEPDLFG